MELKCNRKAIGQSTVQPIVEPDIHVIGAFYDQVFKRSTIMGTHEVLVGSCMRLWE